MSPSRPRRACLLGILVPLLAAFLGGCEGSATQTTSGMSFRGRLVDSEGLPVPGARVQAWPAPGADTAFRPGGIPDALARTDKEGRYVLADLEAGTYNLFGEAGGGESSVLIPGVSPQEGGADIGSDTLRAPGTVTGRVFAGTAPLANAFCYVPGSSLVAITDTSGRFRMDRIPEGTYLMRYVAQGYASAADSGVLVRAGAVSALEPETLSLDLSLQPPAAGGLRGAVDSLHGQASLDWLPVEVADFDHYVIERTYPEADSPADLPVHVPILSWGPSHIDRWPVPPPARGGRPIRDSILVRYRVKAVDKDGNSSAAWSEPLFLRLYEPAIRKTRVTLAATHGGPGAVLCRDSLAVAVSFRNPVLDTAAFSWTVVGRYAEHPDEGFYLATDEKGSWIRAGSGAADTLVWSLSRWGRSEKVPAHVVGMPDRLEFAVSITFPERGKDLEEYHTLPVDLTEAGCFVPREAGQ